MKPCGPLRIESSPADPDFMSKSCKSKSARRVSQSGRRKIERYLEMAIARKFRPLRWS